MSLCGLIGMSASSYNGIDGQALYLCSKVMEGGPFLLISHHY